MLGKLQSAITVWVKLNDPTIKSEQTFDFMRTPFEFLIILKDLEYKLGLNLEEVI